MELRLVKVSKKPRIDRSPDLEEGGAGIELNGLSGVASGLLDLPEKLVAVTQLSENLSTAGHNRQGPLETADILLHTQVGVRASGALERHGK